MHELSIAQNIVEIIRQSVTDENLGNVRGIRLKIGEVSGVVADTLEFSYTAITSATELSSSKLLIEKIPFKLKCKICGDESYNEFGLRICESCGSSDTEVLSGTELQIIEVELAEEGITV
jgi:hydrogenase nickel incorporation protein HypA/HybF